MRSQSLLANLNNGCRKAAAPNNGVASFFFSTNSSVLCHIMPFFEESLSAGNASKKAMHVIGPGLRVMAKNVAKQRLLSFFLMIAVASQSL